MQPLEFGIGRRSALWNTSSGEKISELWSSSAYALDLIKDGSSLAAASEDGTVVIWDVDSGREELRFAWPSHPNPVCLDFSPNGTQLLLTGYFNNLFSDNPAGNYAASIWNPATGQLVRTLGRPYDSLLFGEFSPDGAQVLLGGSADFSNPRPVLELWDASDGTLVRSFPGLPTGVVDYVLDPHFSPEGDRVLGEVAGNVEEGLMWETATGALLGSLPSAGQAIHSACFSPDGQMVLRAVGSENGAVLRDAETGAQVRAFPHGHDTILARFSPNGERVLTRSFDDTRLWNTGSGEHLQTLHGRGPGQPFVLDSVAFSADGRFLFSAVNGAVAMYEVIPAPELTIAREPDGRIVLTWEDPSGSTARILERSIDLAPGDWTGVTVTTPGRYEMTNPDGTTFYRLREP
jgi:WD40 repeat protein